MSGQDVFAKAAWRLIPFMMLLYIVNYIDRVNVGFAALTMNKDLAFLVAIFMTAIPFANTIGGPLSSLVLQLDGAAGLHGWQWLFVVEAAPALLLAFAVLRFLPNGPADAKWLTSEEKSVIEARL